MVNNVKKWITFNVGGTYFMTSRATLARSTPPNSPLHRIATNSTNVQWDRDERGAYMIDRDPSFFQPVLNFLRHGTLILSRDMPEEGVIIEADYFQLPDLVKIAKRRLDLKQHTYQQYQNPYQIKSAPIVPSNPSNLNFSLFNQQDYLTRYVNSILEEGFEV